MIHEAWSVSGIIHLLSGPGNRIAARLDLSRRLLVIWVEAVAGHGR
jgi:hypothetical protein